MTDKLRKQFEEILRKENFEILTPFGLEKNIPYQVAIKSSLINDLLHAVDQQQQELREKIGGMKRTHVDGNCRNLNDKNECIFCRKHYQYCDCERPYNEALDDVLKSL